MFNINKPILITISILFTLSTCMQLYIATTSLVHSSSTICIGFFISLVCFITIFVYIFNCFIKLKNVNKDLQVQILNNKILSELYDKTRTLKHDFANIIQAIGGYIWAKDITGLKKYYSDILGEFKSINSLDTLSPSLIQNPSIYTLIVNKYLLSEDNNIKFNINVSSTSLFDITFSVFSFDDSNLE